MNYIEIMKVDGKIYYIAYVGKITRDFDSLEMARNYIRKEGK